MQFATFVVSASAVTPLAWRPGHCFRTHAHVKILLGVSGSADGTRSMNLLPALPSSGTSFMSGSEAVSCPVGGSAMFGGGVVADAGSL